MAKKKPAGARFGANPIRTAHHIDVPPIVGPDDPLTQLLARVEQLERRVADLEQQRPPSAEPGSDAPDNLPDAP